MRSTDRPNSVTASQMVQPSALNRSKKSESIIREVFDLILGQVYQVTPDRLQQ